MKRLQPAGRANSSVQSLGAGLPVFGEERRQGLWAWKGCWCSGRVVLQGEGGKKGAGAWKGWVTATCQPLLANLLLSKNML